MEKRKQIGLANTDFVIVSVGELNENKNHQIIIRAMARLKDRNVKYIIVGKGKKRTDILELADTLGVSGNVELLGYRTDIKELLFASDCFAFPSRREGLGLAGIEALSAGLPLVASAVGGIKEYCIDGVTGYLCNPESDVEFSVALEKLMGQRKPMFCDVVRFDVKNVNHIMAGIYRRM